MNLVLARILERKKKSDKRRITTYLLAYLLTLIIKKLKISVEQGRLVTTLNILFSVA